MSTLDLDTPHGPARAHLTPAQEPRAALVLGHGAGGGVNAPDIAAAAQAALAEAVSVALVEQPYRVAGRRSPAPAKQLDAAWTAVVQQLLEGELSGLPLVAGGGPLVVQGTSDRFGMPPPGPRRTVAQVAGDHGLKKDLEAVGAAVRDWLPGVVGLETRAKAG